MLRILRNILLIICIIFLCYFNYKLLHQPNYKKQKSSSYNLDLYHQLNFLKEAIDNGADDDMQMIFPEGYVFLNALYGLAWCELAQQLDQESEEFKQAVNETQLAYEKLNSTKATYIFSDRLSPSNGIFYNGWRNYLLGCMMNSDLIEKESQLAKQYEENTAQIVQAFEQSNSFYLESYQGMTWPADNIIAIASIALYNSNYKTDYENFLSDWKVNLNSHLDQYGLIPHATEAKTDKILEQARGSSQSLILAFIPLIDSTIAKEQFNQYKSLFLTSRFGLPGILEYPKGTKGNGDIDSGPVILGVGGSASIVGIKSYFNNGNNNIAKGLSNSVEAFGIPLQYRKKKKYLLGKMPIADAFIAWSNASHVQSLNDKHIPLKENWRVKFLVPSFLLMFSLVYLLTRKGRKQNVA